MHEEIENSDGVQWEENRPELSMGVLQDSEKPSCLFTSTRRPLHRCSGSTQQAPAEVLPKR